MDNEQVGADQIADQLIWMAREHGSFMSNLKLQKLLYYAQGWHLALFDKRLFHDRIEAWVHGPVVPHIYHRFKAHRFRNISEAVEVPELPEVTVRFLNDLAREYLGLDAYALELMTHREIPWRTARGNLRPEQSSRKQITVKTMRDYFKARLSEAEA